MAVGGQDDVAGLEVAMKDSLAVRVVERVGNRPADCEDSIDGKRPMLETRLESAAGDVFHDQKLMAILRTEVEYRGDAGMRQPRQYQCLAPESLVAAGMVDNTAHQKLDRDVAVQIVVVRFPDLAHPAAADLLDESVTAEYGARSEGLAWGGGLRYAGWQSFFRKERAGGVTQRGRELGMVPTQS